MLQIDTGRVVAYVGGLGVSASSLAAKAEHAAQAAEQVADEAVQTISLLQMTVAPTVEITLSDVTTLSGLAVVVARFAWDIYKDRRAKREELNK